MCSLAEFAESIVNTLIADLKRTYQCQCTVSDERVNMPVGLITRVITFKSPNPPNMKSQAQFDFQGDRVELGPIGKPFCLPKRWYFYRSKPPTFGDVEPEIIVDIAAALHLWVI